MFLGHVAVAMAAKPLAPRASLAVLLAAAQFADLLWPALVALGLESVRIAPGITAVTPLDFVSYPYSHSLLMLAIWGIAFGWVYQRTQRPVADRPVADRPIADRAILPCLVVSHWVLDAVSHRPDMPVYPGGPRVGLGLWHSLPATFFVEFALYAAGLAIYLRAAKPRHRVGRWAFGTLAVFLPVVYLASVVGPPPPSVAALSTTALVGGAVLILWSWGAERESRK